MAQNPVSRVAVVILGLIMIAFGVYHFMKPETLVVYVPSFLPLGKMWVYLVGAAFVLAGTAFIAHKMMKVAGYALALLLGIFVVTIHLPNCLYAGDLEMRQMAFVSILKDTALAAFAMYIASNARSL